MTKATITGGALATLLILVALAASHQATEKDAAPATATSPAMTVTNVATEVHEALLYGRITTVGGASYEGRLRWGGDEEALWGHYFNGVKKENPWASHVPVERLTKKRRPIEFFGVEIARRNRLIDLDRPFVARFGDIARIEASGRSLWVTLKSGTVLNLDRFSADDLAEGNAGMLIFVDGRQRPVYLPWTDVEQIDFDHPPAMYPPSDHR